MPLSSPATGLVLKRNILWKSVDLEEGARLTSTPWLESGDVGKVQIKFGTHPCIPLRYGYPHPKVHTASGGRASWRASNFSEISLFDRRQGSFSESYERRCDRHKGHQKRTTGQKSHAASKRGSHAARVPASTASSVSQCLSQGCWSFFCFGVVGSHLYPFMTLVVPKFYFLKNMYVQSEHLNPYKGPPPSP